MKTCSKCQLEKDVTEFRNAKGYKDGLFCWCRVCDTAYKADRLKTKSSIVCVSQQICKICKEEKEAASFTKSKTTKSGLDPRCKECYRNITRERRGGLQSTTVEKRNLEQELKFRCGLCKTIQDLVEKTIDGCCRLCRNERARKNYKYSTQKRREQYNKYKVRETTDRHNRRAREKNAKGSFTKEQLEAKFRYYGNKCIYCDSVERLSLEHVIPLSRGGTNWVSNLAPACLRCNTSKNNRTYKEFKEGGVCPIK